MERSTWTSKNMEIELDSENYAALDLDAWDYEEVYPDD